MHRNYPYCLLLIIAFYGNIKAVVWQLSAVVLMLVLVACSSAPTLPEPSPLNDFSAQVTISQQWQRQLGNGGARHAQPLGQSSINSLAMVRQEKMLFAAATSGQISAVDTVTGAEIWQIDLGADITAGLGHAADALLVATADGFLHLLNAQDGSSLWRIFLPSETLSIAKANDQSVFVQTIDGRISAYSLQDGALIWSYVSDVPNLTLRGTSSPALDNLVVYVGFANGKLVALDTKKGNLLWQKRIGIPIGRSEVQRLVDIDAPLLLADNVLFVNDYQGHLTALDTLSGNILWQMPVSSLQQPSLDNERIYVVTDKSALLAFDRYDGSELWRNDDYLYRNLSTALVLQQWLVVADGLGFIHVLDQQTGITVGRVKAPHNGSAHHLMRVDEDVYLLGQNALLFRFSIQ